MTPIDGQCTVYSQSTMGVPVNPSVAHAGLIATFKRAEADAKAAKRRVSCAKKLGALGVRLTD